MTNLNIKSHASERKRRSEELVNRPSLRTKSWLLTDVEAFEELMKRLVEIDTTTGE